MPKTAAPALDPESQAANDRVRAGQAAGAAHVDSVNGFESKNAPVGSMRPDVEGQIKAPSGKGAGDKARKKTPVSNLGTEVPKDAPADDDDEAQG